MKTKNFKPNNSFISEFLEKSVCQVYDGKNITTSKRIQFLFPKIIYYLLFIVPIASCGPGIVMLNTSNKKTGTSESGPVVKNSESQRKDSTIKVFLTFDDGPNDGTLNIIKLLDSFSVPATFFMVGSHIFGSRKQIKTFDEMLLHSNFEIANHTYNHANNNYSSFYKNPVKVMSDFEMMKSSIDLDNNFARTPGRNIWRTPSLSFQENKNLIKVSDTLQANDYQLIGWDVEWKTKGNVLVKSPLRFLSEIKQSVSKKWTKTDNTIVILLHDQNFENINNLHSLKIMIDSLKSDSNYEFCSISKYPGLMTN